MLAKEQRIGALCLFGIAIAAWLFVALWPHKSLPERLPTQAQLDSIKHIQDSLRRDSLRLAREARWEHKKDSFKRVDSIRFAAWTQERQLRYDSFRLADSLWRDSVGWPRYMAHAKRDTILDLNHCDTAELQLIRGIGRYKAIRIVQYREQLGGYYSPSQLQDEELKELNLDSLLPHFTADSNDVRRMNVNTYTAARLSRHPYLRYKQAEAIYMLRRKQLRLNSLSDLKSIPELSEQELERLHYYLSFE